MLNFENSINFGKIGESIFETDFLSFLGLKYKNVSENKTYQISDTDFISENKNGCSFEVKLNYKDDNNLIIEEYTNINENLGKISFGWFYKCKSDFIVFISKKTRIMIFLKFDNDFKKHYEIIKENYKLINNDITEHNNQKWQSAYRRIPIKSLLGYLSYFKKSNSIPK